jgi:hypothetical protein
LLVFFAILAWRFFMYFFDAGHRFLVSEQLGVYLVECPTLNMGLSPCNVLLDHLFRDIQCAYILLQHATGEVGAVLLTWLYSLKIMLSSCLLIWASRSKSVIGHCSNNTTLQHGKKTWKHSNANKWESQNLQTICSIYEICKIYVEKVL